MVLDFPDPFGPTIAENDWEQESIGRTARAGIFIPYGKAQSPDVRRNS